MNKTIAKTVMSAVLVASALLADVVHAAQVSHGSKVKMVYPPSDGNFIIILQVDPPNVCTAGANKQLNVVAGQAGANAEGVKKMYAAALLALAAEKDITVVFDNATQQCYVNRLYIY